VEQGQRPSPVAYEPRWFFSTSIFETEATAYQHLKPSYGKAVPVHYGNYQVSFPDREFERDKVVNVIMMEYVRGSKLSDQISNLASWSDTKIDALLQQLYESLDQIHALSVVHCDVCPENVIIRKRGDPAWIDWTSSTTLDEYPTDMHEALKGLDIDSVTDFVDEVVEKPGI
jgi:serine/threonine protein kinase